MTEKRKTTFQLLDELQVLAARMRLENNDFQDKVDTGIRALRRRLGAEHEPPQPLRVVK